MVYKSCLCLVFFFSMLGIKVQADDAQWTVVDVTDLSALTHQPDQWLNYTLSPDQNTVAWLDQKQLCLFTFAVKAIACHTTPDSLPFLTWSPNGRFMLLSTRESYSVVFYVYELGTGHFTSFPVNDYLMYPAVWDLSGNTLYFLSSNDLIGKAHVTLLHEYSMLTHEDQITDFSTLLPTDYGESSLVAVSDNGKQIVVQVEPFISTVLAAGFWLVDLGKKTLTALATPAELKIGLPSWYSNIDLAIEYTHWNRAANTILVAIGEGIPSHTLTITSVDWKTGTLTPLLDYRSLPASANQHPSGMEHYESAVTPDSAFLIYYGANKSVEYLYHTPIYALPLSSPNSNPIEVTDKYDVDCGARPLLITMQRQHEIRRYTYQLIMFCPG